MKAVLVCALALAACGPKGGGPVRRIEVAPIPIDASLQVRVDAWSRLSTATEGVTVEAKVADEVPALILQIFEERLPDGPVDVVFCVDTTNSMQDDIDSVKRDIREILGYLRERHPDYRVGVVAYRDIYDDYLTRTFTFLTGDDARIEEGINALVVGGGDDWREHVYAGINTALAQPFRPDASQHIVLMGDAPPHDDYDNDPRTLDFVAERAQTAPLRVRIHTIGIKCDATCEETIRAEEAALKARGRVTP